MSGRVHHIKLYASVFKVDAYVRLVVYFGVCLSAIMGGPHMHAWHFVMAAAGTMQLARGG